MTCNCSGCNSSPRLGGMKHFRRHLGLEQAGQSLMNSLQQHTLKCCRCSALFGWKSFCSFVTDGFYSRRCFFFLPKWQEIFWDPELKIFKSCLTPYCCFRLRIIVINSVKSVHWDHWVFSTHTHTHMKVRVNWVKLLFWGCDVSICTSCFRVSRFVCVCVYVK